jgi:hypothetical protein
MKASPLLFEGGQVVATPGALDLFERKGIDPVALLNRHLTGDWGDVPEEDKALNNQAVKGGSRLLSAYTFGEERVWVITEADRSATTFLLPEEY